VVLASKVLDVELNSAQFNHISFVHFVVQVVLGRFSVSNHHGHFVVHVFVRNRVALAVHGGLVGQGVVLNLKLPVFLTNDDHGLSLLVNLFRLGANADKFNVVADSEDFAAGLSFNIFLGNVFAFVVEEAV